MTTRVTLSTTTGALKGRPVAFLSPLKALIGRSDNCSLRLADDLTVSRQHCLLDVEEQGAWLQDLGSRNGTFLNGQRVGQRPPDGDADPLARWSRCPLRDGDELRVGSYVFHVELAREESAGGPAVLTVPGEAGRGLCEAGA